MYQKFENKTFTADNKARAFIESKKLKTLWFNTGTLCNIECKNCYIKSSPTNDDLVYIKVAEVQKFINEILKLSLFLTLILKGSLIEVFI